MIFTFIAAYCSGKIKSVKIYRNIEYSHIILKSKTGNNPKLLIGDSSNLKLLDFVGNKIIVTTIDDHRVYILNQDEYTETKVWRDWPNEKTQAPKMAAVHPTF